MNCKNCQAELEEGVTLCPQCGTENAEPAQQEAPVQEVPAEETPVEETSAEETPAEETPAEETPAQETPAEETPAQETPAKSGLSAGKITLLVALAVAAIAVVIALIVGGANGKNPAQTTLPTDPNGSATGQAAAATIPADGNPDDVTCKGSYSVSDDEMTAAAETVVATMGDAVLTNADLQVYYWMQVYDFLNQYSSYASVFGLDYSQPLDQQLSLDGALSWQQYFLDAALSSWTNYQAMCLEADENGYELDLEYAEYLTDLPANLETNAVSMGYESAIAMIQADMGVGANLNAYLDYLYNYYLGYMYYGDTLETFTVTDEEVENYFDLNSEDYLANGLEKGDDKYVDVRHILLSPEGGTTDEEGNTTYSEAEWEACRQAADDVLNEWLSGERTEDSFAELANTHSVDGGSNTNGGLYEDVYVGQMVEPFENWCFDETRKTGDYGIVKTDYGYHVMYFVDSELVWYATAYEDLMVEKGNEFLQQILEAHPCQIDYSSIVLGTVDLSATE